MTTNLFVGYLACGTGSGATFTEITGATGYARQSLTIYNVLGGPLNTRTSNLGAFSFNATGSNWGIITQLAVYKTLTGGTPLFFWNKSVPVSVANASSFSSSAGSFNLSMNNSVYTPGNVSSFQPGDIVGRTASNEFLQVASTFSTISGVINPPQALAGASGTVVAELTANLLQSGDQMFSMVATGTNFTIRNIVATGTSNATATIPVGAGIWPYIGKVGPVIVSNSNILSSISASNVKIDLTLQAPTSTTVFSAPPVLNVANIALGNVALGAVATASFYAIGDVLS
jgi:hypothetical protein